MNDNDYPAVIEVLKLAEENKRLRAVVSAQEAIIDGLKHEAESNRVMASVGRHALAVEREQNES